MSAWYSTTTAFLALLTGGGTSTISSHLRFKCTLAEIAMHHLLQCRLRQQDACPCPFFFLTAPSPLAPFPPPAYTQTHTHSHAIQYNVGAAPRSLDLHVDLHHVLHGSGQQRLTHRDATGHFGDGKQATQVEALGVAVAQAVRYLRRQKRGRGRKSVPLHSTVLFLQNRMLPCTADSLMTLVCTLQS